MLSTLVRQSWQNWLIIGSNGSIGSELAYIFSSKRSVEPRTESTHSWEHSHETYMDASIELIRSYASKGSLRIIFCGGKGGFSLGAESATNQQQYFKTFCQAAKQIPNLEKFILISSLGAHCSKTQSPYRSLIKKKEEDLIQSLSDKSLILRLPSMYGYNRYAQRYHGLIGVMYQNLRQRKSTDIYARMETRRNYLSMNNLAPLLFRAQRGGCCLDQSGIINVQAAISLSVFELCTRFFRAVHLRPSIRLRNPSSIDAEDHHPSLLSDARVILNDQVDAWIKWQWMRPYLPSPS